MQMVSVNLRCSFVFPERDGFLLSIALILVDEMICTSLFVLAFPLAFMILDSLPMACLTL